MSLTIEKEALKTILFGILSCRCPITEETERRLFREFEKMDDRRVIDLDPFMDIADQNPEPTPLHLFVEFCSYSKDDPNEFSISHNDALRYFSSKFHFDRIVRGIDPTIVYDNPSFLIGHMLVPVRFCDPTEAGRAACSIEGRTITFSGLFIPPDLNIGADDWMGLHLGTVITRLGADQTETIVSHLKVNRHLVNMLDFVSFIDFNDFQSYGDYRTIVEGRYKRHY